jgi:hypothetical protein
VPGAIAGTAWIATVAQWHPSTAMTGAASILSILVMEDTTKEDKEHPDDSHEALDEDAHIHPEEPHEQLAQGKKENPSDDHNSYTKETSHNNPAFLNLLSNYRRPFQNRGSLNYREWQ